MKPISFIFAVGCLLACLLKGQALVAQQIDPNIDRPTSVYSYYGLGDMANTKFAFSRAMGNIGASLRTPYNINFDNPASYTAIAFSTYEVGIGGHRTSTENGIISNKSGDMSVGYLALAFPITKFWGSAAGIMPYSRTSYDIFKNDSLADIGEVKYTYIGDGTLYRVFWGNGFRYKTFSAGVNVSYLFGTTDKSITANYIGLRENFDSTGYIFDTRFNDISQHKGWVAGVGLQWQPQIKEGDKPLYLTVGLSAELGASLHISRATYWQRFLAGSPWDTELYNRAYGNTSQSLPATYKGGVGLLGKNWRLHLEAQQRLNHVFGTQGEAVWKDNWRISFGGSTFPEKNNGSFFKNISYRFGGYYDQGALQISGVDLPEYGITFGAGMPLSKRGVSQLNVAFEGGQKGSTEKNLYQDSFFRFAIGLTLNDIWFLKRKYD